LAVVAHSNEKSFRREGGASGLVAKENSTFLAGMLIFVSVSVTVAVHVTGMPVDDCCGLHDALVAVASGLTV
jgi:hypothetical protein